VDLVEVFLKMSRAVCMADIDLFTFCLPYITDIFSVTNRPNYARWMVCYHENLVHMEESHPGLRDIFRKVGLSVKRTALPSADQALEHSVNRDAASRLIGIAFFTISLSVRLRWTITRSARSKIINYTKKKMVSLMVKDDVATELRPSRIRRDNHDLQALFAYRRSPVLIHLLRRFVTQTFTI
jgi:hypothetical protein